MYAMRLVAGTIWAESHIRPDEASVRRMKIDLKREIVVNSFSFATVKIRRQGAGH